jgi:phospholipid-translocating ATPase
MAITIAGGTNEEAHISKPAKRMRWATQRVPHAGAHSKRAGILARFHKATNSMDKKRESGGTESIEADDAQSEDEPAVMRRVFFNIPLPDDARDGEGHPLQHFSRNKIRTAKYTPISFVFKNLWYQFHNIANVYFLFLIILAVSSALILNILGLC